MTTTTPLRATALALATLLWVGSACADPPARVARLGYAEGDVSLSSAGATDWVQASLNQPLTTGDHLWTDSNARAELQLGGTAIRLGARSNITLLNLDDNIAQLQLSEGSLRLRVRRIGSRQSVEVDTPNLALVLTQPGDYRVDVDPDGNATTVRVQSGVADAYGEGASYRIGSAQAYRFYGTGLGDFENLSAAQDDALDRWAQQRERRIDNSSAARYLSADVVGYEDLDANGSWRVDASYGNVWTPNRVASGWTPYRDGHWAWVQPWGWTWMDDAPWGYAVSHYGRWARIRDAWSWVPGPQREPAVYAPALVVFLGGSNFRTPSAGGAGNVGWFPLAPREVYQPAYPVSRGYFERVNHSNAVIAPATITTIYNQVNNTQVRSTTNVVNVTRVVYVNQQISGAVVAVPAQAFVQSRPVAKAVVAVVHEQVRSAPAAAPAVVPPPPPSAHAGAPDAHSKPPREQHGVVARTAPPVAPVAPGETAPRVQVLPPQPVATRPATPPPAAEARKTPAQRPPEAARAEGRPPESANKADEHKPGAPATQPDPRKPEPAAAVVPKPEPAAKAPDPKAPPEQGNAAVQEQARKADALKAQAARAEAQQAEAAKAGAAAKAEAAKAEATRLDAAKRAAQQDEASKAEAMKADAAKAEAGRNAAAKEQSDKAQAAQAARADAAKAEAGRNAAAKEQSDKAQAAQAARADAAKAEAGRNAAAKEQSDKAQAAQAARADAAKAEAGRNAAAKEQSDKAQAAQAARADAAKAEAGRNAAAQAQAQAQAARAQANRDNAAKPPPAAPAVQNPPPHGQGQGQGRKNERVLPTEEELRKAEEAAKKH
jgi:hypothetical protein